MADGGVMISLTEQARAIRARLHANGFTEEPVYRQTLGLIEEVGEFAGAYRRYRGMARRAGSFDEVRMELADVVITAAVTAAEMDVDLDTVSPFSPPEGDPIVRLYRVVGWVVLDLEAGYDTSAARGLATVIQAAHTLAEHMDIDLGKAIEEKIAEIHSRGWRES